MWGFFTPVYSYLFFASSRRFFTAFDFLIFFSTSSHEKRVRILRLTTLPEDPACFDMLGTMLGTPCSTIEFVSNPSVLARTKIAVPVVTAVTSVLIKDVVNHIVFHLLVTAATLTVTAVKDVHTLRYIFINKNGK